MDRLEYKGFTGSVLWSSEDQIYYGQIQGIWSLVSYHGETLEVLEMDFREAVDMYLDYCTRA